MDPGTVLASATNLAKRLDGAFGPSQVRDALVASVLAVEARSQRIQEWNHFSDPASKMHIMQSLLDAMITVNHAMQRLQGDLDSIHATASVQRPEHFDTRLATDETHVRVHSVDMGECASLLQFTLTVCQLPLGTDTDMEIEELGAGARMLRRAQISPRLERRRLVHSPMAEDKLHSDDYQTFLEQVLEAERHLPRDRPVLDRTAQSQTSCSGTSRCLSSLNLKTDPNVPAKSVPDFREHQAQGPADNEDVGLAVSTPLPEVVTAPAFSSISTVGESFSLSQGMPPIETSTSSPNHSNLPSYGKQAVFQVRSKTTSTVPTLPSKSPVVEQDISRALRAASQPSIRPAIRSRSEPQSPNDHAVSSTLQTPLTTQPLADQSGKRSSSTSPQDSAYSFTEKVIPMRRGLSSPSAGSCSRVELEQTSVPQQVDESPRYTRPPMYTQVLDAVEPSRHLEVLEQESLGSVAMKHKTIQPTMAGNKCPLVVTLARENRASDLEEILKQGFHVNEVDPQTGRTAVMEAAQWRRIDTCRILLRCGAKLHLKDLTGETALHHAAREGDVAICKMLLAAGAPTEEHNRHGETALQLAAAHGHGQTALSLLDAMQPRDYYDAAIIAAFLEVVKRGDVVMAQVFLDHNVKPKKFKDSWKPVAYAAQSGSVPMLDLVLREKCSLKDKSPDGWTALHFAARHGQQPTTEKFLGLKLNPKAQTKTFEETALHLAAAAGHTATALAILRFKGSTATAKDKDDLEPIHHAVRHGDVELTTSLMDKGAKLESASKYGWKPIHLAAANGHVGLLAEFMTRGISIEEKLQTPSFRPEKRTNAGAQRGYGAEIRWPHTGARPLHLAIEFGHDDAAHMLISGGCEIDDTDSRGWRPVHYAAFHCQPDILQTLLSRGVAVDTRTVDGFTASELGFREYGLAADQKQRLRVQDLLRDAEMAQKETRLKTVTNFRWQAGNGSSKTAAQRNLVWRRAMLAESLCESGAGEGQEDEMLEGSVDGGPPSTTSAGSIGVRSLKIYGDGVPGG